MLLRYVTAQYGCDSFVFQVSGMEQGFLTSVVISEIIFVEINKRLSGAPVKGQNETPFVQATR
jgi:hypothetical protein